jgi:argonaute-like protein implicated in RNA metabolism and viral defense
MLSHYLKTSIEDIENLIELTNKDILDIKEAKHEAIFKRTKIKSDLVKSFENKKSMLDNELIKLVKQSDNKPLEQILDKTQQDMLESMKKSLLELKQKNKEYARFVVTVSEFYNSLLDSVFPRDLEGYQRLNHKPASLLKVRA